MTTQLEQKSNTSELNNFYDMVQHQIAPGLSYLFNDITKDLQKQYKFKV